MEERQLKCFLAIAELGSVTRAADRLDIAQPSLSQMLLRLEDELSIKLFERTSRGVLLTEPGRIFREHANTILREMSRAREEIRNDDVFVQEKVSIGLPSSISTLIGARLIVEAKKRFPGISINVSEAMSGHIRRWLEEGSLDVGVLYNVQDMRALSSTQVAVEELFLVGPPRAFGPIDEYGIAIEPVSLAEPERYPLILPTQQHGLRRFVDDRTRHNSSELNIAFELDSLLHIKTLVEQGVGFSLLAHAAILNELKEQKLSAARIVKPVFRRGIFVVRNPSQIVTRASVRVNDLLISLMSDLIKQGEWLATRVSSTGIVSSVP
ncbi:LysR family transcriptional regulator [Rhizobium leguminosarum]|uniref:LysR family transcriptional regulator n=1 Tax=Rhizobium leguminosarum TaxID=384 RepID=UPI0024A7AA55|nr:LysR family transcriptional regulator [Rhizobium leguminosarum]MDI5929534.1 LysR family transcriptional regulator [Rhizobium leguminosarum]